MAYTLYRHVYEPRFLTNLSHENIYVVNIFMRLNEFSSVRLISIVRTCLKGLYAMSTIKDSEYTLNIARQIRIYSTKRETDVTI